MNLNWGLHLGIWLVSGLFISLVLIRFLPLEISISRTLTNTALMAALFYGNNYLVRRFFIPKQYVIYLFWALALLTLITLVRVQLNFQFIDYQLDFLPENNLKGLYSAAIVSNLGIQFLSIIYSMLQHRKEIERTSLEAVNKEQAAQLQFLRAQINPHFLFNTLNNIYSLAVVRSEQTAPMVLTLSELLRYVIYDSQLERVPLQMEIRQIKRFIDLFQMRSENPQNITFTYDNLPTELEIEPMILIPLVENCFKHGDFDTNEAAFVSIELAANEQQIEFKTINSKNDQLQQKDKTGGVGLENIRQRLDLKYLNRHKMKVKNEVDRFEVHLKLISEPQLQHS